MKVINSQLLVWQATPALLNWFSIRFPAGGAEYQDVLDALAADDLPDDANWLMDHAGADDSGQLDITTLEERNLDIAIHDTRRHVFAAGKLTVSPSLNIAGWVRAGISIEATKSLRADQGLISGWNIRAGGSIQTDGEIKAGTRIDVGMNILAGEGISSACAVTAGGDIQSGKEILVGSDFDSTAKALEAFDSEDADVLRTLSLPLQRLWAASSGSRNYWDAITSERSPFGIEASGSIYAGASITSATTIKAGDSIAASKDIQAGRAIRAGGNVTVGGSIQGGWAIVVEGSIQAGNEIVATSIEAKGGIRSEGKILFTTDLKAGGDILVAGDVRESPNDLWGNISAAGELRIGGEIQCEGNIRAASIAVEGDLISGRNVQTDGDIIAGKALCAGGYVKSWFANILAGHGIRAGGVIQAARSIQAGHEIVAGYEYGVFAATGLRLSDWRTIGQVVAQQRPQNLISGYWAEKADPELAGKIPKQVKAKIPWMDDSGCWHLPSEGTIIKVIGIGNSGGNSIDHMIHEGLSAVEFAVVDADPLALNRRFAEVRIQIGGIGDDACAMPSDAGNAEREELAQIVAFLRDAHLVFIVSGAECVIDNGATATIAKVARELGIFTVALVTGPYILRWNRAAAAGSACKVLARNVDSVVVIRNDQVPTTLRDDVVISEAFKGADQTANEAVRSIGQLINLPGLVNIDFEEVRAVMSAGATPVAVMESGIASGPNRGRIAAEQAVASLLLDGLDLSEAQGVLVNITVARGLKMKEVNEVMNTIREGCADDAHVVFGALYDERMGSDMRVTVVAVVDRADVAKRNWTDLLVS